MWYKTVADVDDVFFFLEIELQHAESIHTLVLSQPQFFFKFILHSWS